MVQAPVFHAQHATLGFLGLGVMGQPMALNLVRAGHDVIVWNRTPERAEPLRDAGARVAGTVDEVFTVADVVFLMLIDEQATDTVLGRGTTAFADRVAGRLVVSTGSASPGYSRALAIEIEAAGGRFVESPVSGQRGPAQDGQLVAFLGGDPADLSIVRPLLAPLTKHLIDAGPIGAGLLLKLTVNHYLNVSVAALAEATHFADAQGLDRALFERAVMAGPLASDLAGMKLAQFVAGDFDVRAGVGDSYNSTRLGYAEARAVGIATPLLDLASTLYGEAVDLGGARRDMIAVIDAIQARTATLVEVNND